MNKSLVVSIVTTRNATGEYQEDSDMVVQLKENFHITGRKGEVVQIFMVLLNSWSVWNIEQEFRGSD
jgi:hypothetical protein